MNIVFKCEFCRAEMQAAEDSVGKQCICVACGKRTTIGTTASSPANSKDGETGSRRGTAQQLLSIACPQCSQSLDYARALIGTKGLCRNCHSMLVLPADGQQASILKRPKSHIAFECPTCLQLFEGSRTQVGQKGRCTNCESIFIIAPLEPKDTPSKLPSETPSNVPKRTSLLQSRPSSTIPNRSDELGLAPEAQSPDMPRPKRPAPTLRPQKASDTKPKPSATSVPAESPTQSPLSNVPWPDFASLGQITSSSTDPYTSPSASYSPVSSKRVSLHKLISETMDCLFPAAFILGLPPLFGLLLNFASRLAIVGIAYLARQFSEDQWYVRMPLGILALIIVIGTPIFCFFAFFPVPFKLANLAAKGKSVDTSMLNLSMYKRLSIVGYTIVQVFLLGPLLIIGVIPFVLCIALATSSRIGDALMMVGCSTFLAYVALVIYSMFAVGACAVADNRPVSRAISLSFRSLFAHPLVLLPICAIELVPLAILVVTGLGFLFVGGPYVQIRSAKYYHLLDS